MIIYNIITQKLNMAENMSWKYAANLQENTHVQVWFQ